MDKQTSKLLADIVDAVDTPEMAAVIAVGVSRVVPSDLVSLFIHDAAGPHLLHDNFVRGDWRDGLSRYIGSTHRADPFVLACRQGAPPPLFRLGKLARHWRPVIDPGLIVAGDEEAGYRTQGWPAGMEEIGLGLPLGGSKVAQLSLYRPRSLRHAFSERDMRQLASLHAPLGAALRRLPAPHRSARSNFSCLSSRERQIAELLVRGLSSEAISLTLNITVSTVKTHRKNIYNKMDVSSSLELLRSIISPEVLDPAMW